MMASSILENVSLPSALDEEELNHATHNLSDAIVAQATAPGIGGVGIIRVSGCKIAIKDIANKILKLLPKARYAYYGDFLDSNGHILDKGIALYFKAPNSYTGEEILEFHCHGGPIVIKRLITEIIKHGVRHAEPGEFTKRAWLNGKMDLLQVESVCDLINAASEEAAQSAANTLSGRFSELINDFLHELTYLRTYVEASIDFSDEQIDFLSIGNVATKIDALEKKLNDILSTANQGVILTEGVKIVISGKPNAGKSSLLNALCKKEEAIVTAIPGTTRDLIKTKINIQGVPIELIDTAGVRDSDDVVEQQGVKKAIEVVKQADFLFLIIDGTLNNSIYSGKTFSSNELIRKIAAQTFVTANSDGYVDLDIDFIDKLLKQERVVLIVNKIDLLTQDLVKENLEKTKINIIKDKNIILISAKNNLGLNELEALILDKIGFKRTTEGNFTARSRHIESLKQVYSCLLRSKKLLVDCYNQDLIAEELKLAQDYLGAITGTYSSDELLGKIFSSFCIGK